MSWQLYLPLVFLLWAGQLRPSRRLLEFHRSPGGKQLVYPMVRLLICGMCVVVGLKFIRLSVLLVLLMVGWVGWRSYRVGLKTRQQVAHAEALAGLLSQLHSQIEAGVAPGRALITAVGTNPKKMPAEMQRIIDGACQRAQSLGGSPAATFMQSSQPELVYLGKIWALAEHHGLPLAALLDHARGRLDAQLRHHKATAASLSGPKASALILSALPLAGMGLGKGMGADPWGFLSGGGLGAVMLVIGVGLSAAGWLWCQEIITKTQGVDIPSSNKGPA